MALRITIDVFSGRPNPSVVVTGLEERDILERIAPAGPGGARGRATARAAGATPPRLGYRGLVVEPLADPAERAAPAIRARRGSRAAAPTRLRIAQGAVRTADGGVRTLRDDGVESFVTSPAARSVPRACPRACSITSRARSSARARSCAHPSARAPAPPWRSSIAARARRSGTRCGGTTPCTIQTENNCYNYATDVRTDTYAQPGRANGAMYASLVAADVHAGAIADALVDAPAKNRCPGKGHLVALCMSDWDFHWYRKQRSGNWTHKPGPDPITQLDNANVPIPDPRSADRGPYTQFVGFMIVLHGHVKIG